jgi:pheromone shutdown protein TraB
MSNSLNPLKPVARAIEFTPVFIGVVALCWWINSSYSADALWWPFVLFGLGIAFVGHWLRAIGALLAIGAFAGLGVWLYRKLRSVAT